MSWVEQDGVTVEKKVEGWVIGEDGRPGLRGEVVDRSGEAVRDTLLAGMLSGLSGFLKQEATSSVYPVSPFGQTNALKGKQALGGAASTGAGNALDKLAEFSIKRAEQMQPVILIASGRVVDVVFKSGVDLRPEAATPSLTLMDAQHKEQKHDKDF
ncbi:bacterial conjugation TrbI-like protein [Caedimonas varicaedens]|uniref:Bacterial conjugation TrbI-like protein n=1 Tax=Caedimonas varicaedens TaxID=1629334 RepID=A0A0K8MFN1_9PROT|nr:bacterial conjugation TrbI-like protein [Caedimonas varicaedens]